MRKENKTVMEMRNVSYVERPHAILKFIQAGFSVDDIIIRRIDTSHYDMVASKWKWHSVGKIQLENIIQLLYNSRKQIKGSDTYNTTTKSKGILWTCWNEFNRPSGKIRDVTTKLF